MKTMDATSLIRWLESDDDAYVVRQDVINYIEMQIERQNSVRGFIGKLLAKGYTQRDIANKVGVSQGTISAITRGAIPSETTINMVEVSMI